MISRFRVASLLALALLASGFVSAAPIKPKVRAITAFVKIDRSNYRTEFAAALAVLRQATAEFQKRGYEVQTIRITTQPFPEYTSGLPKEQAVSFLRELDGLATREKFSLNIGPAVMRDDDNAAALEILGEDLVHTQDTDASAIIASEDGIHWNSIRAVAGLIRYLSEHSEHSRATFSFAATAMLAPYTPFFPGSYHTGAGHKFSIGFEGANVVDQVFASGEKNPDKLVRELSAALTEHAQVGEDVGKTIEQKTGWEFLGIDPTPAPDPDVSIGAAMEKYSNAPFGSSGTMTAASLITRAVKAVQVKQVGYSGLMLPVLEDRRLAERWGQGTYSVDSLLAYSAVCGTGLDTVPLPGNLSDEQLVRMLGDVASLAFKWHKPLTARLQVVAGKKAGDLTEFDSPYLANTKLQALP